MKSWKTLAAAVVLMGAGSAAAQVMQARPTQIPPAAVQKYDPQQAEIEKLKGEVKLLEAIVKDLQTKQQNTAATAAEALTQNVNQQKALNQGASDLAAVKAEVAASQKAFQNHKHWSMYYDGQKEAFAWRQSSAPLEFCAPGSANATPPACTKAN